MTTVPEPPDDDAGGGFQQSVRTGGTAYVAGRDIHIDYAGAPAFAVRKFVDPEPAGLAELTRARQQPSVLLTAQRQTIAFTGRAAELSELRQWQDAPAARGVWAWHAPGGQGKTRLGRQLGRRSAAAGWRVGVATHQDADPGDADARPLPRQRRWLPGSRRPLLLLVDYAERWPLHDLLRFLSDCRQWAPKVRVLLLARSVDWWPTVAAELHRRGFTAGGDGQPRPLSPLAEDVPGRRWLFETACERFTQIYRPDMPAPGWPGQWNPPGDLGDDSVYGITLGVHMAALAAVDAYTRNTVPPKSAGDVSRYLLDRERSYWARLHGTAPDVVRAAARTVLLACLTGSQPPDDGIRLLELTGLAARPAGQKLLDAHDRCYPPTGAGTVLEPMYPDRLAEDFIALSLPASPAGEPVPRSGHTDSWAATTLVTTRRNPDGTLTHTPGPLTARTPERRPPGHTSRILIFLGAAAGRNQHVRDWLHTLLTTDPAVAVHAGGVALTAVVAYTSPALAETIYRLLPERSLDLDPAAAVLARHLLDHSDDSPERHARHSGHLALRLANTGRRQEALAPAQEAASVYRRLAETDPDAYLRDLGTSLSNLGMVLSGLGRPEQALAPAEEATRIHRGLAETDPDAYLPDLAGALNNLGTFLAEVGQRERALSSTREAANIYRRLAETNLEAYLPDLAMSLNNLGIRLSDVGQREQALAPAEAAVTIRRRLAEANPDAYLPDLAGALNNLGKFLSDVGRPEQALALTEEATRIYRRLAETNPDAYLSHLAMSLNNLGIRLSEVGRQEEALAPAVAGVAIQRRLAEADPDAHLPDLAMTLINVSVRLSEVGRPEQALAMAEEATRVYRGLAEANPDAYLPYLAGALNNLGNRLSASRRPEQALVPAEESVTIRRRLARANPDAYLPHLAGALNNLGNCLSEAGRPEQALSPAEEATRIYRRLAETNPDAHLPDVAMSLNNLGNRFSELGRPEQALTSVEEATRIYRRLAETNPDAHLPHLATSLWAYGRVCMNGNANLAEALESVDEAIGLYQPLVRRRPHVFAERLVAAYRTRADVLDGLGRAEEATDLRRRLD
ncbi:tetratricopeptide repeat protein [Actinoplanes sp. NEAU-A12]|uniref:Tetratricopeptide repeat protein n=1 Tax=Actinoplanes sandaracinus TaxID=3045177 RepID=A0ABT6WXZ0_9ACTN|nr:tetratricopeptide repeat protein [Actinoplanes sandaracinus]MDI6104611.1 tetratricopeptide repeat protein [Actinoplanes sandaracinus]